MSINISQSARQKVLDILLDRGQELIRFEAPRKVVYRCGCGEETKAEVNSIVHHLNKMCKSCSFKSRGKNSILVEPELRAVINQIVNEKGYINVNIKAGAGVDYTCVCGKPVSTTYLFMKKELGCPKCYKHISGILEETKPLINHTRESSRKTEYGVTSKRLELIKTYLENEGKTFIRIGPEKKVITYLCSCGKEASSTSDTLGRYKATTNCPHCPPKPSSKKLTFQQVQQVWADAGEFLPEQTYVNNHTPLTYICSYCHTETKITLNNFQNGKRCILCRRKRAEDTMMEHYGTISILNVEEFRQKRINTCMDKYGVEYPLLSPVMVAKSKATCMKKYGVENPMQNAEICEKSAKSQLKGSYYKFPSGNTEYVQGYEPMCLDMLLKEYDETEIKVKKSDMPVIMYFFKGKRRRYYPDIFIPKDNLLIEVKSEWTLDREANRNEAKFLATVGEGYSCHVHVFDPKVLKYKIQYTDSSCVIVPWPPAKIVIEE